MLAPSDIAEPLRVILARYRNIEVLLGEVVDFDLAQREIVLDDDRRIPYDRLIVAAFTIGGTQGSKPKPPSTNPPKGKRKQAAASTPRDAEVPEANSEGGEDVRKNLAPTFNKLAGGGTGAAATRQDDVTRPRQSKRIKAGAERRQLGELNLQFPRGFHALVESAKKKQRNVQMARSQRHGAQRGSVRGGNRRVLETLTCEQM